MEFKEIKKIEQIDSKLIALFGNDSLKRQFINLANKKSEKISRGFYALESIWWFLYELKNGGVFICPEDFKQEIPETVWSYVIYSINDKSSGKNIIKLKKIPTWKFGLIASFQAFSEMSKDFYTPLETVDKIKENITKLDKFLKEDENVFIKKIITRLKRED